jgi:serine/threonine-protein kinase
MIGRYRVVRELGAGGMARVYLAEQDGPAGFKRQVVIKKILRHLLRDERFVQLFLREARIAARLRHRNVVQVHELGEEDGEYYIVMEYLEGLSLRHVALRTWLHREPLPLEIVLRAVADAAMGLNHAHTITDEDGHPSNLVHRDISPDNLLLCADGTTKVLDFGLAKSVTDAADHLTSSSEIRGKISFMSPEQLEGRTLDGRADLFSLGVSLYWLCTASYPFRGATDPLTMHNILYADPEPPIELNPSLPVEVNNLTMHLLAKARKDRPRSGLEVFEELMKLAGSSTPADTARFTTRVLGLAPLEEDHRLSELSDLIPCEPMERVFNARTLDEPTLDDSALSTKDERPTPADDDVTRVTATPATISDLTTELPAAESTAPTVPSQPVVATELSLDAHRPSSPTPSRQKGGVALASAAAILVVVGALLFALRSPPAPADDTPSSTTAAIAPEAPSATAVGAPAEAPRDAEPHAGAEPPAETPPSPTAAEATTPDAPEVVGETTPQPPTEAVVDRKRATTKLIKLRAPPSVTWLDGGRTVGRGSGQTRLRARVRSLRARDSRTGGLVDVAVTKGKADWASVPKGRAFFIADPWAKVTLGRRALGTTPFQPVELPEGQYRAVLVWEDKKVVKKFRVRAGDVSQVTAKMR